MVSIPRRATLSGVFSRVVLPQDGPPNLGMARMSLGSIPGRFDTDSHRFIWTFLGDLFLVISRVVFTVDYLFTCMFFFSDDRPLGKSPHQSCRALRGEVDSSIPRVFGGLLVVVCEDTRK